MAFAAFLKVGQRIDFVKETSASKRALFSGYGEICFVMDIQN